MCLADKSFFIVSGEPAGSKQFKLGIKFAKRFIQLKLLPHFLQIIVEMVHGSRSDVMPCSLARPGTLAEASEGVETSGEASSAKCGSKGGGGGGGCVEVVESRAAPQLQRSTQKRKRAAPSGFQQALLNEQGLLRESLEKWAREEVRALETAVRPAKEAGRCYHKLLL